MERLWLRDRERVTSADPVAVVGAGCQLATLHRMPAAKRRHGSASDRRDTPPVDVFFGVTAGLLARRSSPLPVFPTPCGISDLKSGSNSLLTVAGAALEFRGLARFTGFPLSYQILRSGRP